MKIGITSDCSSGLEYAPFEHNIKITRTTIHFGDEELIDGIDITADEFYNKLESSTIIPSTSAPSPKEIMRCCEEYRREGYTDVIHFPISFGLSAYGENLLAVADDYVDGINLHVFDCHSACIMEGYTAKYAEILANKGYSLEEIFAQCQEQTDNTKAYFVVDDLKYLVKNGRLGAVSGFIGGLVKIKPILQLGLNGKIEIFERVRTHQKAVERMVSVVEEDTKDCKSVIYIVQHSNRLEDAKALAEHIKGLYKNIKRVEIATVTPTVGAHIGSGIISLAYIKTDNLKEDL